VALPQNLKDTRAQPLRSTSTGWFAITGVGTGFFVMAETMLQANSLATAMRELAILRADTATPQPYETHQHE